MKRTSIDMTISVVIQHDGPVTQELEVFAARQVIRGMKSVSNKDREDEGVVGAITAYGKTND